MVLAEGPACPGHRTQREVGASSELQAVIRVALIFAKCGSPWTLRRLSITPRSAPQLPAGGYGVVSMAVLRDRRLSQVTLRDGMPNLMSIP